MQQPTEKSNSRLRVKDHDLRSKLGVCDLKSLKFDPTAFVLENPRLDGRIIEASAQVKSLEAFTANPRRPMTYIVAGNPDDLKAKYFAFYLAETHRRILGHLKSRIEFVTMLGNFKNPLVTEDEVAPSLIVVSNLTVRSSDLKFEKTRDLIEKFPGIPKIIVVAGEDPISFAACRLHVPCHGIAYFGSKISKTFQEVI